MKRIILTVLMVFAVCLSGAGCGDTGILNLAGDNQEEQPLETSSDISIPILKFRTLNPILTKDEDIYFMEKLIYEPLIALDASLAAQPRLAADWVFEENGMELIFRLREDVYWHDGKKFDAKDVAFTIDALQKAAASNATLYAASVANIKSVEANGLEVRIRFKASGDNSIEKFTFPIIPAHRYKNAAEVLKLSEDFLPIGTGPYIVKEVDPVKRVVLEGNDQYYGSAKADNTLLFKIIPDKKNAVGLFDIADLMIVFSKDSDRNTVYGDKDVNIFPFTSNELEVLGFNAGSKPFSDRRIRHAVAAAIDARSIIDNAYFGNGVMNDNIYFPNYLGVNSTDGLIAQNMDKAVRLLAEAGYINRDDDIFVEDSGGSEISIRILVNSGNAERAAAANIIKNNLDKLPIHSYIIVKDWSGYTADLNAGEYDAFIGGWQIEADYDMRFALQTGISPVRYSNAELDALMAKMCSGIDNETKLETFSQIREILLEDLPYYCITYKTYAAVTSKSLQGIVEPYFFDIYRSSKDWTYSHGN